MSNIRLTSLFCFTLVSRAFATTYSSDGTVSDFNSKYASASNGDTITIPSGSFAWASAASTITKAIKIQGAGAGKVVARSASSVAIGTGTKTFTIAAGASITAGDTLTIYRTGGQPNGGFPSSQPYMTGTVTSYSSTTLTMSIASTSGSGTHPLWFIVSSSLTTITHNAGSSALFVVAENTSASIEISGIHLVNGTGTNDFMEWDNTSGGKPILVHDCLFENSVSTSDCIQVNTNRGIVYKCDFMAVPFSAAQLAIHMQPDTLTTSWTTASTIGTLDTDGTHNLYVEDCNFEAFLNATDFDNNSRAVIRYSYFDNAGIGTHGPDTSNYGNRHLEVYNCTIHWSGYSDGTTLPYTRLFYLRGGILICTDCVIDTASGSDYPGKPAFDMTVMNLQRDAGPNPSWGANWSSHGQYYHCPRQVGMGYVTGTGTDGTGRTNDSITYVGDSEPCYFWNNTGVNTITASTSDYGAGTGTVDSSAYYIQSGRDYFNGATARPGYTKYVYPHPTRTDQGGGTGNPIQRYIRGGSSGRSLGL